MNRSICQKLLPLAIALVAMPFSSLAAITTNVSNVAELVDALSYINSLSPNRENTIRLSPGVYDVSECEMRYETVENNKTLVLEDTHLALNYVTLTGVDDDRRKTVIYGGGESKKRRIMLGRNSTVKNLTISNGWAEAKNGGGYCGYYSATPGSLMREIVSNCVVTCCYAGGSWGGGSGVYGAAVFDSELCHNTTAAGNCFGAANKCDLHRCVIHSNHSGSYGGGLGHCYAYDCTISNNTAASGGAGVGIASATYNYRLENCKITDNRSSGFGGGIYTHVDASGMVTNTRIYANTAIGGGGGVYGTYCMDCVISNNGVVANSSTNSYGGGGYSCRLVDCDVCFNYLTERNGDTGNAYGGGAYNSSLTDCRINGNTIFSGGKYRQGGGLYSCGVTNSFIYENFIDATGQGAAMNGGSACGCVFSNNQTRATNRDSPHVRQPAGLVVNCAFYGQTIACSTKIVVENCRFTGCRDGWTIPAGHNVASMSEDLSSDIPGSDYLASSYIHMRNCLIADNQIKYISKANSTDLTKFENCTFADNQVAQTFYDYGGDSSSAKASSVVNCIFTRNYDKTGATRCDLSFKDGTNVSFENCLIGTSRSDDAPCSEIGTVTADNAMFNRKSTEHPYEIKYSSPARGAGKKLDWMTAEATDIRGQADYLRLREGKVDIGCYQCWLNPVGFIMSLK